VGFVEGGAAEETAVGTEGGTEGGTGVETEGVEEMVEKEKVAATILGGKRKY
jgi:hypothetical protein